jgi:hypothetical protein
MMEQSHHEHIRIGSPGIRTLVDIFMAREHGGDDCHGRL